MTLAQVAYLFAPLIIGMVMNGLCIKFGWLAALARPIDGGRTLRGARLFGANKTYRGVLAVAIGTALGFGLQAWALHSIAARGHLELFEYDPVRSVPLAFAVGAAAMLSELPNSFLKRQLHIAPGAEASGAAGAVFYVLDQIDMLAGAWLVLSAVLPVSLERVLWSVAFLFAAHQIITRLGYALGMRATRR